MTATHISLLKIKKIKFRTVELRQWYRNQISVHIIMLRNLLPLTVRSCNGAPTASVNVRIVPKRVYLSWTPTRTNIHGPSVATLPFFSSTSRYYTADPFDRHKNILLNPDSIGVKILTGNVVERKDKVTGEVRQVMLERQFGSFWMIKDLKNTNDGKVILSNPNLIEANSAQRLPPLQLEGEIKNLFDEPVMLPDVWCQPSGLGEIKPCTLLLVSFKKYGYDMFPTWAKPFQDALMEQQSAQRENKGPFPRIAYLCVTEGGFLVKKLLMPIVKYSFKKSTSTDMYGNTYLYFGNPEQFRDALRMHNNLTAYVLLVDYEGRVRWMGSGKASEDEAYTVIKCAKELGQEQQNLERQKKAERSKVSGPKYPSGAPQRIR